MRNIRSGTGLAAALAMASWACSPSRGPNASSVKVSEAVRSAAGAATALNPTSTYVQLFKWRWPDIATECTKFLGPQGFGAVQISPPAEHIRTNNWWNIYQPVNHHNLVSDMGNATQLQNMITTCHNAGVHIYADVVYNQMAADTSAGTTGVGGTSFDPGALSYAFFSAPDFHSSCSITYADANNTANCWLLGMPDLNTGSSYVQGQFAAYLTSLINMGVDGFRIDAAKHILPNELAAMIAQSPRTTLLGEPVFITQEVVENESWIDLNAYINIGTVNEFRFARALRDAFRNNSVGSLPSMIGTGNGGGSYNLMASAAATVFVDNHDTERTPGDSLNLTSDAGGRFDLANIFMLTQPYGRAQLQSGFTFPLSNTGQNSPSASPYDANGNAIIMGAWDFVHRWADIYPMVKFRRETAGQAMTVVASNNNKIAYRRGSLGFAAINNDTSAWNATFATGLPAGTYCNIAHGLLNAAGTGCTSDTVTVNSSGNATVSVPARGGSAISAVVIYTKQMVGVGGGTDGGTGGTDGGTGGGFTSNFPAMNLHGANF
jgi:alpha-amylase